MCKAWRESFQAFFDDMGPAPEGTTIDRINNDGNYEPENCRWATPHEQGSNTSSCHKIHWRGGTRTLIGIARIEGVSYKSLHKLVVYSKMDLKDAINTLKSK